LLRTGAAGAHHVQTKARDDGGQPAAQVVDVADVGAVHPQPGFLDGVVGLAARIEHPVGDRSQVRTVLLERFRAHRTTSVVMIVSSASSSL
jgi:hypothetical protein